jgi:histidinol-phosphate aminotransferase
LEGRKFFHLSLPSPGPSKPSSTAGKASLRSAAGLPRWRGSSLPASRARPRASFAQLAGATVIDISLGPDTFSFDVAGVLKAITKKNRLIFLGNPNNPTGSVISRTSLELLLNRLPGHIVVFYDEVYHHYETRPDYRRAADYIVQGYPLIGLHSFSKAYGLAGLRLGYAFSTPEIAGYLAHLRRPFMIRSPR